MKKQLLKVKQIADQTFLRGDKSEVLNKELEATEKRLEALKQTCHVLHKKMSACHQGSVQEPFEKRKKRMPEIQLSNCMQECLETTLDGNILLWQVLENCGELQGCLGDALLEGQQQAEKDVLSPLHDLLEVDIPNVLKLRKQLFKLSLDMDTARTRYESAVRHVSQSTGPAVASAISKADSFKEELEDLTMKVEQAKDTFAAELYALVSRETSICQMLVQWYDLQAAYHQRALNILQSNSPALCKLIEDSHHRPLYGYPIEDHLRSSGREIALVLEACICCLLETATQEEGLFRIAGSASKVKKLKNALDAGVTNMCEFAMDPHSVAGALKSYLRDLPEPLMTFAAYDDWIQADRIPDTDARLQRLWQVLNSLPKANYNNLRYLLKFLHCLCKNSEVTKMSSQNLSIVMSPNLLWSPVNQQSNHMGLNMSAANAHSAIVETLIRYCDWFFPDEVVFRLTLPPLSSPKTPLLTPPVVEYEGAGNSPTNFRGIINTAFEGVNGEATDDGSGSGQSPRVVHRPGKKPAPPVPPVLGSQGPPDDYKPGLRTSPPAETNRLDRPISRSATLDRPGKPKRSSTRKSHDNLANILLLEGSKEVGPSETSSQPMSRKNFGSQSVISGSAGVKSNPWQGHSRFHSAGDSFVQPMVREEPTNHSDSILPGEPPDGNESHSVVSMIHPTVRKEVSFPCNVPQPMPRKDRDSKEKVTDSVTNNNEKLETDLSQSRPKTVQISTKINSVDDSSASKNASVDTPAMRKAVEVEPKQTYIKAQVIPPIGKEQTNTECNAPMSSMPNHAKKDPSSPPVYANISSQLQKEKDCRKQDPTETKETILRRKSSDGIGSSSAGVRTSDGLPGRDSKPQVPSKPAALTVEATKLGAESTQGNSLQAEARSLEKLPDETDGRTGGNSIGDRWHFLHSGVAQIEKAPDRPPKVPSEGGGEDPPIKKAPPSPSLFTKVKPPRPHPPAPPAKPKMNNDNEETRL